MEGVSINTVFWSIELHVIILEVSRIPVPHVCCFPDLHSFRVKLLQRVEILKWLELKA